MKILSWDLKWNNIHIIAVPEGEEREKQAENLHEEIMAENVSNLGMERQIQIQKAHRIPRKEHKDIYTKTQYN